MFDQAVVLYPQPLERLMDIRTSTRSNVVFDVEKVSCLDSPSALVLMLMAAVEAYEESPTEDEFKKLTAVFEQLRACVQ